jgi:hypothetical protein
VLRQVPQRFLVPVYRHYPRAWLTILCAVIPQRSGALSSILLSILPREVGKGAGGRGMGRAASPCAPRPRRHASRGPLPPLRGRGQIKSFSRRSHAPELCPRPRRQFENDSPPTTKEGAERRKAHANHSAQTSGPCGLSGRARQRALWGRARLPALCCGTRQGERIRRWLSSSSRVS